ncbi:MAG: DinB family protein [Thermoanaerobaculia bacterium]
MDSSPFTNPSDAAAEEAGAYIEAVLALVGDRDPLEILAELPSSLAELTDGIGETELGHPEADGKWSMIEILAHLADSELVWAWRLRLVLAEADPVLTGYDQDRWASYLHYRDRDLEEVLKEIRFLRVRNLRLLGSLTSDEFERSGRHSERGVESVSHMVRLYAGHDLVHRRQLKRVRLVVSGRGT